MHKKIIGSVTASERIVGHKTNRSLPSGRIHVAEKEYIPLPEYEGDYEVTPTEQTQTLNTANKKMIGDVTVNPIPDEYIVPSGSQTVTSNDTYDVTALAEIIVDVETEPSLQTKSKSYTPTETAQSETVAADSGYDGLDEVNITVGAISPTYVGSGITRRSSSDLSASGATVTAPAGCYSEQATKDIASGSAATPATTIQANPSITVSDSGLITAGVSASQNVTPTVVPGYIASGSSGAITVTGTNTLQLTNGNNLEYGLTDATSALVGVGEVGSMIIE